MNDAPGGSHTLLAANLSSPLIVPLPSGTALLFSAGAPSRPEENQDGCAVLPYGEANSALIVTDGVGGGRAGGAAARLTLDCLERALAVAPTEERTLRAAILDGIDAANREIRDRGTGAAATVSVVAVEDGAVQPYHVGDSPIVVVGGRGRVKHQSVSHGPVGYAVEAGLLSEAEAMGHEERHLVSNLLGIPEMRVEMGPRLLLASRDTVLLASDGVTDNLYLDEIVETIRKGPLERAGTALARRCRRRMLEPAPGDPSKEDDCTFILFRGRRDAPPGPGK